VDQFDSLIDRPVGKWSRAPSSKSQSLEVPAHAYAQEWAHSVVQLGGECSGKQLVLRLAAAIALEAEILNDLVRIERQTHGSQLHHRVVERIVEFSSGNRANLPCADRSIADCFGSKPEVSQMRRSFTVLNTAAELFGTAIIIDEGSSHKWNLGSGRHALVL